MQRIGIEVERSRCPVEAAFAGTDTSAAIVGVGSE
jgi:hypothetical protein